MMLAPFRDEELDVFCEPEDDELEINDGDWSNFQHFAQKVTGIKVGVALYPESVGIMKRKTAITNQKICPNLAYLKLEDVEEALISMVPSRSWQEPSCEHSDCGRRNDPSAGNSR
ncbi:hypothetical protein FRB94_008624 [Tulasnella sp. JGI-2019a]|nr:hypothetical protein FRB93_008357 [Tulasnella sp. JGI-2019a]KAG8995958.1 hypothetical protein FRB94_008624 [Tulasnella sp. JGI-2019a]KAG9027109.1 hypothetical protein FRB95_008129 [Tulasnella sp. JGI-2019a]